MDARMRLVALIVDLTLGTMSLGVLLYFFIARADESLSVFHQKLAIGIFSVTVTTIVVLLGLTLPDTAFGSVSGKAGFVTFTLTGTLAAWVIVFVITAKVFGSPALNQSLAGHVHAIRGNTWLNHKSLGWNYYRDWRADLNSYRRVIEKSELHFIDDLLPKVFYHGRYDLLKPQKVTNSTLFFFSRKGAVKFQRIQAQARIDNGQRSEIYLPQTASTPQGRTTCLHFIRNEERLAQTGRHTHGEWKVAPFRNVDILLVAVYENDEIENGDYVYVDVSKYVDLELMDSAMLDLMIVSDRRIEEYNVWEVAASLVSTEKPVPLMFRNLDSQVSRRSASVIEKNLEQMARIFDGWDVVIDQAMNGVLGTTAGVSRDEVEEFFQKAKTVLGDFGVDGETDTFQKLFRSSAAADCVFTKLKHQQNVILSTFTWC